jgi:hypothetical protein
MQSTTFKAQQRLQCGLQAARFGEALRKGVVCANAPLSWRVFVPEGCGTAATVWASRTPHYTFLQAAGRARHASP